MPASFVVAVSRHRKVIRLPTFSGTASMGAALLGDKRAFVTAPDERGCSTRSGLPVGDRGVVFLLQRREDDAVAVLVHGLLRCYTKSGDSTADGTKSDPITVHLN
jgi:hypothetical protein